jgi:hypothetical protein
VYPSDTSSKLERRIWGGCSGMGVFFGFIFFGVFTGSVIAGLSCENVVYP